MARGDIQPRLYVVVVESDGGRKSRTIGPYRSYRAAADDSGKWDGKDGRKAWSEPVYAPEDFKREPELPPALHA